MPFEHICTRASCVYQKRGPGRTRPDGQILATACRGRPLSRDFSCRLRGVGYNKARRPEIRSSLRSQRFRAHAKMFRRVKMSQTVETEKMAKTASEDQSAAEKKERRSLAQRIEEAAEVLKRLQEQKRKQERALREQNEKELRELLKAEKLDDFDPTTW